MKKQTAIKYENIINNNGISSLYFWAEYDSVKGKWCIVSKAHRRFYTIKELKKYMGGRL